MNLKIKLIDESLPLPEYHTKGSVAFDLYARINVTVLPFTPILIPANLIVQTPPGYFLMVASRSSTPLKKGLMLANGIGVVDQDYCGDEDEIKLQVLNFSKNEVTVKRGERIGQALLVKIARAEKFVLAESMEQKSRGGFGSTG